MSRKMILGMVAWMVAVGIFAGCAGDTGKGEGEACSGPNDCGGEFQCQPVAGRSSDYCCPAPLILPSGQFASGQATCQPVPGAK